MIKTRIRNKRDTLTNWSNSNPILLNGEIVIVEDGDYVFLKRGDGIKHFNNLPFIGSNVNTGDFATKTDLSDMQGSIKTYIDSHSTSTSNPHGVTKIQLGLDKVNNTADVDKTVKKAATADIATKATQDANGSVITETYATKKNLSDMQGSLNTIMSEHSSATNNPHKVTKAQLGLGNVDNTADSAKIVKKASTADTATKATQDANGNVITSTYATKVELSDTYGAAVTYTDQKFDALSSAGGSSESITVTASKQSAYTEFISTFGIGTLGSINAVNGYGTQYPDNFKNAINNASHYLNPHGTVSSVSLSGINYKHTNRYVNVTDNATILTGISAKTNTLKALLQELIDKSHTHSATRTYSWYDCQCNCGDSDSCIIKGNVLTDIGYRPIENLKIGDYIIGLDKRKHKILSIINGKLQNRKAIKYKGFNCILTSDHIILDRNSNRMIVYDIDLCKNTSNKVIGDDIKGSYNRDITNIINDTTDFYIDNTLTKYSTKTYTLIIEDCEWCIVDDLVVACAKAI